ncbi:MAG: LysE family transporter [Desulfomonile sp.]|nr:LysE family transporter [Desulfomonile sp.]
MDAFFAAGITLGLSAGLSPGPLTTLVISQSLQHGAREGLKVAVAPFITDVPIILVSIFVLAQLRDSQTALGLVSLIGVAVLSYLAYESFKADRVEVTDGSAEARSLGKGALVNFFSPHPYLFWLAIGGPRVIEAWGQSALTAAGFVFGFYTCLVGSKMSLAFVAARSRPLLTGAGYRCVMRLLGAALLVLAFYLLWDGLVLLRVLSPSPNKL